MEELNARLATGVVNTTVPGESEIAAEGTASAVVAAALKLESLDCEQFAGLHDPNATAAVSLLPAEIVRVVEPELVRLTGV